MAAADFSDLYEVDAVRMSWNVWPNSRVEATKCVIPFGALYTPAKVMPNMQVLPYEPVRCKTCRSALNPFCRVDFMGKIWICPFCYQRNHFPPHYASIAENNMPAELFPQYTTIEYTLPSNGANPSPVYLFVLDTCIIEEELGFLRDALKQAIGLLPEAALVGLITYGTQVHVHELGFAECPKSYVFRGSKEVTKQQIMEQLGLVSPGHPTRTTGATPGQQPVRVAGDGISAANVSRFLLPITECEFVITAVLEELQRDAFPVPPEQRSARCTGMALSVAAALLGACVPGVGARIMSFIGGPCTEGPGTIVAKELSEPLRSHKDLDKEAAPHYHKAVKFYEGLAKQLVAQGHVLDLFACALDQVGVAEMKVAVERTGGLAVLAESFGHAIFKDSFKRIFETGEHSLGLSFNGIFEVNCSRDIKISGVIGPCASLEKKGPLVADAVVGQGHTTAWKMCGFDASTTLATFFEIVPTNTQSGSTPAPASSQFFLQFMTQYQHSSGQMRLRSTTITRHWVDGAAQAQELIAGFDQEAAAVLVTRLVSYKMEFERGRSRTRVMIDPWGGMPETFIEEEFDASRWLDRTLIRLASKFGDYRKDDPASFSFSPNLAIYPQFMFNLRRSQFVQVFNNSPDETAYFRLVLNRENVLNSLVMVQPTLLSYSFNAPPEPALLDVASITPDRITLLDAYFSVVVQHGLTIAQWRNAGYHHQPEHAAFAQLLKAPMEDAEAIVRDRFPAPRFVDCDQHGSQARFLTARLNPSATHSSVNGPAPGGDVIFTDDVSLQVFMEHLQRLAVQS